jgi:dTDP-4-amino-4,6-dideoxygalactose transaminase
MDNLRAAILRPQLTNLEKNINRWNERYQLVESELKGAKGIEVPVRFEEERYVGSSIQFRIPGITEAEAELFIEKNKQLGVELKWFGNDNPSGFTSNHKSWKYVSQQQLNQSDEILSNLFDLRLPLTFSLEDCNHLSEIIIECSNEFLSK